MASTHDIKMTILKVAGNPVSGPVAALADEMASEIAKLDQPDAVRGKQKRVVDVIETRTRDAVAPESDDQ